VRRRPFMDEAALLRTDLIRILPDSSSEGSEVSCQLPARPSGQAQPASARTATNSPLGPARAQPAEGGAAHLGGTASASVGAAAAESGPSCGKAECQSRVQAEDVGTAACMLRDALMLATDLPTSTTSAYNPAAPAAQPAPAARGHNKPAEEALLQAGGRSAMYPSPLHGEWPQARCVAASASPW
jgi:hypothetical protein